MTEPHAKTTELSPAPTISGSFSASDRTSGRGDAGAHARTHEPPPQPPPSPEQIKRNREAQKAIDAILRDCPVDDIGQVRLVAQTYRLAVIRENIDHELKRAAEQRQQLTWYRLRSCIRGNWAGKERIARAVQKVKNTNQCTLEEAEAIVQEREHWRCAAIDAADELSDEQIHATLLEAIGALPTEQLRAEAHGRLSKLAANGLSARALATGPIFARVFAERAALVERGGARYVMDEDAPPTTQE